MTKEREHGAKLFEGKLGRQMLLEVKKKSQTFTPGANLPNKASVPSGPSKADIDAIKVIVVHFPHTMVVFVCISYIYSVISWTFFIAANLC